MAIAGAFIVPHPPIIFPVIGRGEERKIRRTIDAKYVPLIEAAAREHDIPFKTIKIESREQAQNAPAPFTSYSMFYNGQGR